LRQHAYADSTRIDSSRHSTYDSIAASTNAASRGDGREPFGSHVGCLRRSTGPRWRRAGANRAGDFTGIYASSRAAAAESTASEAPESSPCRLATPEVSQLDERADAKPTAVASTPATTSNS